MLIKLTTNTSFIYKETKELIDGRFHDIHQYNKIIPEYIDKNHPKPVNFEILLENQPREQIKWMNQVPFSIGILNKLIEWWRLQIST